MGCAHHFVYKFANAHADCMCASTSHVASSDMLQNVEALRSVTTSDTWKMFRDCSARLAVLLRTLKYTRARNKYQVSASVLRSFETAATVALPSFPYYSPFASLL